MNFNVQIQLNFNLENYGLNKYITLLKNPFILMINL